MSSWVTRQIKGEPRDLKVEDGKAVAVAAWRAPLRPLEPEACANCGAGRHYGSGPIDPHRDPPIICPSCGLTEREDRDLHRRYALKHGSSDLCVAAEAAAARGRKVLAVKLATAAFHYGDEPQRARQLRGRLLREIGLAQLAEEEDTLTDEDTSVPDQPIVAEVRDMSTRLARARLRLENDELVAAGSDAVEVLADEALRPEALAVLVRVAELLTDQDPEQVVDMINAAAPHSHRTPDLCFALARAEYARRKLSACRRWLLHTRRLAPTHKRALELLDMVEDMMNVASTTGPFEL